MFRNQYRQGDILISQALNWGQHVALKRKDSRVLAEGEATGHLHEVEAGTDIELYEDYRGTLWLKVNSPEARITHPEHAPIIVPGGQYEVIRQHEFDPLEGRRQVTD